MALSPFSENSTANASSYQRVRVPRLTRRRMKARTRISSRRLFDNMATLMTHFRHRLLPELSIKRDADAHQDCGSGHDNQHKWQHQRPADGSARIPGTNKQERI